MQNTDCTFDISPTNLDSNVAVQVQAFPVVTIYQRIDQQMAAVMSALDLAPFWWTVCCCRISLLLPGPQISQEMSKDESIPISL